MAALLFHPVAFIFIAVSPDQAGSVSFRVRSSSRLIPVHLFFPPLQTLGFLGIVAAKKFSK